MSRSPSSSSSSSLARSLTALSAFVAAGCAGGSEGRDVPSRDFTVVAADTRVSGVPDSPDFQLARVESTLPPGPWKRLVVRYELTATCGGVVPAGQSWPALCDPYDRLTQVRLAGAPPLVLVHAVTPFGGDAVFERDVSDYASLLVGTHEWEVFVSTGADPAGQAAGRDAGWNVAVTLIATPGEPDADVVAVTPAFQVDRLKQGDALPAAALTVPPAATRARLDLFSTGHGLVGQPPCDEFCKRENRVTFDAAPMFSETPWTDCSANCTRVPISHSISCGGDTFDYVCGENPMACPSSPTFDRSGWCPGQASEAFRVDLGDARDGTLQWSVPGVEGFWSASGAVVWLR